MQKIAIIGSGGSGKSSLSVELGQLLGLPIYHLDALYWKPNWTRTPHPQWCELQRQLCREPRWIMDGNYKSTLDIRLEACDTVIFLDVNRYLCIYRAVKRALKNKKRADMAEACEERLDPKFIKFLWNFPRQQRPLISKKLNHLSQEKTVIIAKSGKQALEKVIEAQQSGKKEP